MKRVLLYALGVLLIVLITWIAYVSIDTVVPFARLELTALRLDGRAVGTDAGGAGGAASGKVLVMFGWRGPQYGAHCVRVNSDVAVAVGGAPATAVRLGGGTWVVDDVLPIPRHRCINEALYEVDRDLARGVVAASLGDGRGNPALISAQDLVAPPSLVVVSPQPAHAGDRATIEVAPDTLTISRRPTVQRAGVHASPVDVEGHRLSFAVPAQWAPGSAPVRVTTDRIARVLRCERAPGQPAPPCFAFGVPVDEAAAFVVDTSP